MDIEHGSATLGTAIRGGTPFAVEPADDRSASGWDEYVDRHPRGSLYHRFAWRTLIQDLFGHETRYLYAVTPAAKIVGVLPLVRLNSRLFGDFMVSMPYVNYGGAVADSPEIAVALMRRAGELAADLGIEHIEFRDLEQREGYTPRTDKVIMELELPARSDDLWAGFEPKLRAQVRRATKEPVAVVVGHGELLSEFYRVFTRNMRDLGTPVYGRSFFQGILDMPGPPLARIVVVRYRDEPVAAGFLLGYKDRLEIPWASSVREYNRYGVNMLMYWEAIQLAIREGFRIFDFGRSTPDSGTYRFKQQWGAAPRSLYWHYWVRPGCAMPNLTPHNPKYRLAIRLWQRLPLFAANRIGPLLVRNLP